MLPVWREVGHGPPPDHLPASRQQSCSELGLNEAGGPVVSSSARGTSMWGRCGPGPASVLGGHSASLVVALK